QRKNSAILFVGYLDEESNGHRLLGAKRKGTVLLDGENTAFKCEVEPFNLSAHAGPEDAVRMASAYSPRIFIPVHGNKNSRWALANAVSKALKTSVFVPYNGQELELDPHAGRSVTVLSETERIANTLLGSIHSGGPPTESEVSQAFSKCLDTYG